MLTSEASHQCGSFGFQSFHLEAPLRLLLDTVPAEDTLNRDNLRASGEFFFHNQAREPLRIGF